MKKLFVVFSLALCLGFWGRSFALDVPPAGIVVDSANILSPEEEQNIETAINAEKERSGTQIGVLIITSLEGEVLENYSIEVARQWGVGRRDIDNGVLILVAVNDHKTRIEVGKGLEGALTDIESGRIIDYRMLPDFRNNNYSAGLIKAVDGIRLAIADEYDQLALETESATTKGSWFGLIFIVITILQWLIAVLARTKSWWAGGIVGSFVGLAIGTISGFSLFPSMIATGLIGLGLDWLVSRNFKTAKASGKKPSWWAGGSPNTSRSSSGSGRSDGSFGGGSFGGGGSSGSW